MMENQGVDHETSQHTGGPFYPLLGSLRLQSSGLPLQADRQQRRLTVVGLYRLGVLPFVSGLFTVLSCPPTSPSPARRTPGTRTRNAGTG